MSAGITLHRDDLRQFAGALAQHGEPGLAIGVYAEGALVAHAAAGCAAVEHGVPVTEHTLFDIASVSKHMTATCLLLLARDGLIDLDADIRPALPELAIEVPVTLRQCLSHTGGLRDYFALCEIAGIGVPGMTEARFTDLVTGQRELDFAPGSAFSYSNTGYALASLLVRRATGHGLAQVAAERVFGPLGMTATHFRDDVSLPVPRLAAGYVADDAAVPGPGQVFRRYDTTEEVTGDGAVVTSLTDLAGWHAFMASGEVLGADIRDGLLQTRALTSGGSTGYGLGLQAIKIGEAPGWWHSGSWAGYRAAVIYLPEFHAGVTVLANRNDRYASHVALATAAALLGGGKVDERYRAVRGVPARPDAGPTDTTNAGQDTDAASALAGIWHEPDQDVFLEVAADDGQLLIGQSGDDAPPGRFVLGADGRWHGTGSASASCYFVADGELVAIWGLADRADGRFSPAESVTGDSADGPVVPAGLYWNDELRVNADLRVAEAGARIAIGLAPERALEPAGAGVWRCPGGGPGATPLTVRASADGAELLVSAPGARRVRFTSVPAGQPAPELPRGLLGWAR